VLDASPDAEPVDSVCRTWLALGQVPTPEVCLPLLSLLDGIKAWPSDKLVASCSSDTLPSGVRCSKPSTIEAALSELRSAAASSQGS
jgi:hypothetical protein